jgi:hypothetical protein
MIPMASQPHPKPGGLGCWRGFHGAFRTLPFPGTDPDLHVQLIPSASALRSCATCRIQPDLSGPGPAGWLWTVEEGDGGSLQLDATGQAHYTAPLVSRKRTFHVRATSSFDSRVFGRVALEVRPHAMLAVLEPERTDPAPVPTLRVVAGNPATLPESAGTVDPWVLGGRFSRPHGLASLAGTGQWLVSYPGNRVFCQFEDQPSSAWHQGGGAGLCQTTDPRDWGEHVPLACPSYLADNRRPGADWLCAVSEPEHDRIRSVDARGVVRSLARCAAAARTWSRRPAPPWPIPWGSPSTPPGNAGWRSPGWIQEPDRPWSGPVDGGPW